jgi:hypothetical protein
MEKIIDETLESPWSAALWQQFGAAIEMLDNALRACPASLWRAPVERCCRSLPARQRRVLVYRLPHPVLA